ncbi:MAG: GDSL-type esterase/lipase family protein [Clostridiales bacterium]|nr:GDSL-type esterase/lipase family protein [Clostridiales bacterium]
MKKILSISLTILLALSGFNFVFASGESADDPILIGTAEELIAVASDVAADGGDGKYYKLTADINLNGADWTTSIGSKDIPFAGTFDGNGKVISNFKLPINSKQAYIGVGLFGTIGKNAVIKKLGFEKVEVYGTDQYGWNVYVGALAGEVVGNASVSESYIRDFVIDSQPVRAGVTGGLVGNVDGDGVKIENCYSVGFVEKDDASAREGGLIGSLNNYSSVKNCYSNTILAVYANSYPSKTVENSYCTSHDWYGDAQGAGTVVTSAELKEKYTELGSAYVKGYAAYGGYPALAWESAPEGMTGAGSETDPYIVKTVEHLVEIAGMATTEGKYFELANDIDIENSIYSAFIGTKDNPFKGDFNGNGHVIKNYTLNVPGNVERGIFAAVGGNAYIHDLGVENVKVILTDNGGWDATAGGLIACAYDNAVIEGCYVDGIEFKADYVRSETWYGELKWGGGLIGYGNGDGLELRDCYSKGFVETYQTGTYPIVNNEGGLFGMFDKMLSIEDCYSDTTIGRYLQPHLSRNSYHNGPCLEWPEGYTWGYNSFIKDVKTLGYDWNNDFVPVENGSPVLKWQKKDGYLNLIPSGEMTGDNLSSLFGVSGGTTVVSNEALRQSTVLAMPANSAFSYNVDLSEGDYYRVSFRGKTQNDEENAFTFTLGDKNLTDDLSDKTLGKLWETKVVFVKADTANATLTISSDTALYIDDVEIIKVDPEFEITAISESILFEETYADVLEEMYVSSTICDGLEVKIDSDYNCIDLNGKPNDNVPVGFGTIDINVTVSAAIADRKAEKQKTITINKRTPYEIENLGLYNKDGEKVFGISAAEKVGTVDVKVNTEDEGTIFAALYKDGILKSVKMTNVEAGKAVVDLPIGNADKLKIFALVEDTLVPLSIPSKSYDTIKKSSGVVMHTIGDSLCATYKVDETLLRGWGQVMGSYLDDEYITVDNTLAESGMTANKFFTTGGVNGGIKELIASYNPGDYLLVQLGTNDSTNFIAGNKGFTKEQFRFYMDQFVVSAREKGVIPVFVTAPERLSAGTDVKTDGVNYDVNSYLEDYPQIMRDYAAEYNVPVIDLNRESYKMLQEYGYSGTKALGLFVSDELHYTEAGANWIAGFVADELVRLGLPVGDCVLDNN